MGLRNKKGVSLIVVIFAMMLFGMLGWTLAVLVSGNLETSTRILASERALGIAEAGLQNALMMLKQADSGFDADTDQINRLFGKGQYIVTRSTAGSDVTVVSTGYVPQQANYEYMRSVQMTVSLSAFGRGAMIRRLLDWSAMDNGSNIDGEIMVVDRPGDTSDGYEGNGNSVRNEPADLAVPGTGLRSRTSSDSGYPEIDMNFYYEEAGILFGFLDLTKKWEWEPPAYYKEGVVTAVQTFSSGTNWQRRLRVTVNNPIFSGNGPGPYGLLVQERGWPNYVFLRNKRNDGYPAPKWDYRNWGVIVTRHDNYSVTLEFDSLADIRNAANIWQVNDTIVIGKRFTGDHDTWLLNPEYLWYVKGDVIIDVRDDNASFRNTTVIAEGDIVVRGSDDLFMRCYRTTSPFVETFPNIATKSGDIYSPDTPSGGSGAARAQRRNFDGLIYSETGDIYINYIDGIALMANNVTLDGYIRLRYTDRYVESNGFSSGLVGIRWKER